MKIIALIGLVLLEAFTSIMSGCSVESFLRFKVAVYRLDAELGDANAKFKLARAYYNGR